ncbi:MAG TPA: 4Fe-4S binding protein, partial [Spirochaetota bacterium]|nr:4Fe-4S binding protein [Spirochaetota bacterium]
MKSKHWSLFRAIIQLAFWLIFVGSIVYLHDPLSDVRYGLYPSLSIYSIFIGSITGHTLKYAFLGIAIALLTVLFGRFFCGWICPLGATIDASDTVIETKAKNK